MTKLYFKIDTINQNFGIVHNGESIVPVIKNSKYDCYEPEIFYGRLNDTTKKTLGVKLLNIFSKRFEIEISSSKD